MKPRSSRAPGRHGAKLHRCDGERFKHSKTRPPRRRLGFGKPNTTLSGSHARHPENKDEPLCGLSHENAGLYSASASPFRWLIPTPDVQSHLRPRRHWVSGVPSLRVSCTIGAQVFPEYSIPLDGLECDTRFLRDAVFGLLTVLAAVVPLTL